MYPLFFFFLNHSQGLRSILTLCALYLLLSLHWTLLFLLLWWKSAIIIVISMYVVPELSLWFRWYIMSKLYAWRCIKRRSLFYCFHIEVIPRIHWHLKPPSGRSENCSLFLSSSVLNDIECKEFVVMHVFVVLSDTIV